VDNYCEKCVLINENENKCGRKVWADFHNVKLIPEECEYLEDIVSALNWKQKYEREKFLRFISEDSSQFQMKLFENMSKYQFKSMKKMEKQLKKVANRLHDAREQIHKMSPQTKHNEKFQECCENCKYSAPAYVKIAESFEEISKDDGCACMVPWKQGYYYIPLVGDSEHRCTDKKCSYYCIGNE